jgi:transmembrane sensor
MSTDDDAARWAVRIDRGLSPDEEQALVDWISADLRRKGALLRARAAWSVLDRARALPKGAEDGSSSGLSIHRRHLFGIGGSIAALLIAGYVWHLPGRADTYLTGTGEIRRVALTDSSLAVVNSQSEVKIRYSAGARDVELTRGEAWFQVAKNKSRPFTVSVGPVRVQAVGTAFDVRRRDGVSEVVVTEGTVQIWSAISGAPPLRLGANQRAVISDAMGVELAALTSEQSQDQLAWRDGRIILDEITLGQAASEFNRYNHIKLSVAPPLASQRIVGSFHIDDLEGFVSACTILTNARVERTSGTITILK